ncbi:MAG: hypothetical protein ACPHCJ_10805 [Oceanococcaceae bacterium]
MHNNSTHHRLNHHSSGRSSWLRACFQAGPSPHAAAAGMRITEEDLQADLYYGRDEADGRQELSRQTRVDGVH